jgi:hypothetical protein
MPPPPFTRVRLAQGFPLGISAIGHLSQSLFWDRRRHRGRGEPGLRVGPEIDVQRVLGARTGLFTAAAMAGATRSTAPVDRQRIYTRLRRDVYAGWAFVEVEPEIDWLAAAVTSRRSRVVSAILRLELQFSSDGRRPTPPARLAAWI